MKVALGLVFLAGLGTLAFCSREGARPVASSPRSTAADAQEPRALPSDDAKRGDTGASGAPMTKTSSQLHKRLDELRRGGRETPYVEPTDRERDAFAAFITALDKAARDSTTKLPVAPEGFVLEEVVTAHGRAWLVAEHPDRRRGAGAYVVRRGPSREVVVEAPHTFFDVGTLPIAVAAFEETNARALLVNTVHRNVGRLRAEAGVEEASADEDAEDGPSSDVAHAARSFFQVSHVALACGPAGAAVQIHGFRDALVPGAGVVLSAAGTSAAIAPVATSLREVVGASSVRVYPDDVRRLGGTTNAQAHASGAALRPFVHVEISRTLRDTLAATPDVRARFVRALIEPMGGGERGTPR